MGYILKSKTILSLTVVAAILMFGLSGCAVPSENGQTKETPVINFTNADGLVYSVESLTDDSFTIEEYPVNVPADFGVGRIAQNSKALYFIQSKPQPMEEGQFDKSVKIMAIDMQTKKKEEVYSKSFENAGLLNELCATENHLVWVIQVAGERRIEIYDLSDKSLDVVKTFDSREHPILLSTDGEYVSWYKQNNFYGENNEKKKLMVYNIADKNTQTLCEDIARQSPYSRAKINDGVISFIESIDERSKKLKVYDLKEENTLLQIKFDMTEDVENSAANRNFVIWSDGIGYDVNIYTCKLETGKISKANDGDDKSNNLEVFAFNLMGDSLITIVRGNNQIVCRDMNDLIQKELTADLKGKHRYYIPTVTPEGAYVAFDIQKDSILFIDKKM